MRVRPRVRRNRVRRDPFTTDKRTPIEILSRLAGRTNFITPRQGGGSRYPITDLDIAAAIATARDKLGSSMAMAIACQRPQEWDHVHERGRPRLVAELRTQREMPGVVDGPFVFRARIALYDAFHLLLYPTRRQPVRHASKVWGIGERVYGFLLHRAEAMLDAAANTAASDATKFLFREIIEHAGIDEPALIHITKSGELQVWLASDLKRAINTSDSDVDEAPPDLVDLLLSEPMTLRRMPGILTLRDRSDAALIQPRSKEREPSSETLDI